MNTLVITLLFVLLGMPSMLCAQQIGPKVLNLDEVTLEYPRPWDQEAHVLLDFTVKSDGSVSDFSAVGGFHESRFVDAAIAAVEQLQFEPATERGERVDWPGFQISARFVIRNLFHSLRPPANEEISRAEALIREGRLGDAENVLKTALANTTTLFFEDALINLRLGEVYLGSNRPIEAVHALARATQTYLPSEHNDFNLETAVTHNRLFVSVIPEIFSDDFITTSLQLHSDNNQPRVATPAPLRGGAQRGQGKRGGGERPKATLEVLNNTLLESAYQRSYLANISVANIAKVINTYNNLEELNDDAITPQMLDQIGKVRQLQNSGQQLTSSQLLVDGNTLYYPTHRILAAVNVDGAIETVDFQCENRVIRLPFQAEVEWSLPESWGQCALRFRGDDGVSFNLVEFPE